MKLLIASDIHGSAHYCAQLMARIEAEKPDQVLLLGDLLYHGPRNALPEEYDCPKAYDMLNGIKDRIVAVRGNCDSEVDQMVLEFPIMADYALLEADGVVLYATHGHLWNERYLPPMREGTVLLIPLLVEQPPVQPVIPRASTSAATVSRTAKRFIFIFSFTCSFWN